MFNLFDTKTIFLACAIIGSIFFIMRLILASLGGIGEALHDHHGVHTDVAPDADQTEASFKVLSTFSVAAFAMMFGWVGLACYEQFALGSVVSFVFAVIVGATTMVIVALYFTFMRKATSTGTQFSVAQIIGHSGTVYQQIPQDGAKGIIQVHLDGILHEVEAISEGGEAIPSFSQIIITKAIDEKTVFVKPTSQQS